MLMLVMILSLNEYIIPLPSIDVHYNNKSQFFITQEVKIIPFLRQSPADILVSD